MMGPGGRIVSNALVGLLEPRVEDRVLALIDDLESRFGLVGIGAVPWPHVSFVVADGWDPAAVRDVLGREADAAGPVIVRAEPWSLFTGESPLHPAIVRSVVRTAPLAALQARLLRVCDGDVQRVSPFVDAGLWNPHITVASRDLTPAHAGAVMSWLAAANPPPWTGRVDRLGLIEDRGDHHALVATVPFGRRPPLRSRPRRGAVRDQPSASDVPVARGRAPRGHRSMRGFSAGRAKRYPWP
jgi:hypothetical protein